jgi:hypothetical protein
VVLEFESVALSGRHGELIGKGISHDYDRYNPHVTISYRGAPADLMSLRNKDRNLSE